MALFRGLADDLSLDSWLNDHIWPMEANLNGEYCYIGALLGAVELIKSGTTTFSDMYFYMEDVARAVDEAGSGDLPDGVFADDDFVSRLADVPRQYAARHGNPAFGKRSTPHSTAVRFGFKCKGQYDERRSRNHHCRQLDAHSGTFRQVRRAL